MDEMKIGVVGAAGRMGRMLVREVAATEGCRLAGAVEAAGRPEIGRDAGEVAGVGALGIAIGDDPVPLFAEMDAVLEFSTPAATVAHAALAAQGKVIHVIGTTGLDADQASALRRAARHVPIVWAPNMSAGINLLLRLIEELAGRLGDDWDIEVLEMHHRHKVDAPSGTALALGRAAAAGRGVELDAVAQRGRDGMTGERRPGAIGFGRQRVRRPQRDLRRRGRAPRADAPGRGPRDLCPRRRAGGALGARQAGRALRHGRRVGAEALGG
jgi:4-hydroxy-tetrahydrodipicolinate reductase